VEIKLPDRDAVEETLIWIDELDPPYCRVSWSYFPYQNPTRVRHKAEALMRLYAAGQHRCKHCGDLIEPWRRLDARYCCEGCRKAAARRRRSERLSTMQERP
jgi:hypothetical protein